MLEAAASYACLFFYEIAKKNFDFTQSFNKIAL